MRDSARHLGGPDPFDAFLGRLSEDRAEIAATARARQRWLRTQADEASTFAGVLLDLAERQKTISLRLSTGQQRRGVIRAIGADFVAMTTDQGQHRLISLATVVQARATDQTEIPAGDRAITSTADIAVALAGFVGDRPTIIAVPFEGETVSGELRGVGIDVARLRCGSPPETVAVHLTTIAEIVVLG